MGESLIGRDDSLRALRAGLESALSHHGTVATISGEAGIGKTALAQTLASEASIRGAIVTWGRAWEFADAPPYFPIWPCLRTLGIERAEGDAFHLWEAVVTRLGAAAAKTPVVWVLEDLHAADLGTLDLLTLLAQPLRGMRALIIATVRTPDPRLNDRMLQRLTRIARDGIDVRPAPLSAAEVSMLTEDAMGRAVTPKALDQLVTLTGGNPLFVIECARAFRAAGGLEGTLGSLPSTVRQIVTERLSLLPDSAREMLGCGAILGREFTASGVAAMTSSLPAQVIDVLLPGLRAGFVNEPSPGRFAFSHAIVRDAIEDSLEQSMRARLHGLAERALAGEGAEVIVERARHALSALPSGTDAEHALELAMRASTLLEREGAFDRAFDLQVRVADARRAGFLPAAPMAEQLAMARLARAAGRSSAAREICEEVIRAAQASHDAEMLASAVLLHAMDVRPGVIDRTQVRLLEEARDALDPAHVGLRCRVLARLATALQPAKNPSIPIAMTHEAIRLARTADDEAVLLDVLELAVWGLYTAPLADRIATATELSERALARSELTKAISAHVMLAIYFTEASDFEAFGEAVDTALRLSETVGHPRHRWRALLLASMRATMFGHFAEAESYISEVVHSAPVIDEPALPWTLGLHEIFRARAERRDDDARARLEKIDELMREDVEASVFAALNRATCAARAENFEQTRSALARIGSRASIFYVDVGPTTLVAEAYALAGTDDERRAARDTLRSMHPKDVSGEVMSFIYEGTTARVLGLLDASLGDFDAAERELREARDLAIERRHTPWIAQTSYELGKLLRRLGRETEANELMTEAQRIARELGMPGLRAEPTPAAPTSTRAVTMKKDAGDYRITYGSASIAIKDSRGVQLLARLVENCNEEIHVLALISDEPGGAPPETTAGEMIDESAKQAYRARLIELDERIGEAERRADARAANKVQKEKEALLAELRRAVGLGGRTRQAGSATERARVNVQRRLKDAVARISEADEALGRFFERSLRTGTYCCFRPK